MLSTLCLACHEVEGASAVYAHRTHHDVQVPILGLFVQAAKQSAMGIYVQQQLEWYALSALTQKE